MPPNHPDISSSLNNIGLIYKNRGEYEQALDFYLKSLEIKKLSLPPNHPDIASTLNNIAGVYFNKGENDFSLDHYR